MSKINNKNIKQLSRAILESETIEKRTFEKIVAALDQKQLKLLLSTVRHGLRNKTVTITSPAQINVAEKKTIENMYKGKEIQFVIDPSLGGGIAIQDGDNILDLSLKGTIIQSIDQIKQQL